jgi:hypothetical protein
MSTEKNVQTVKDFFAAMGRSDQEGLLALVSSISLFDGLPITEFDVLPTSASHPAVEGLGSGSGKSRGAVAVLVGFVVSRIAGCSRGRGRRER